jgi:hypothetical protein
MFFDNVHRWDGPLLIHLFEVAVEMMYAKVITRVHRVVPPP